MKAAETGPLPLSSPPSARKGSCRYISVLRPAAVFVRIQNDASVVMLCAVKVVFMTFLHVGSIKAMRWVELDEKKDLGLFPQTE